jgi:chemotaxis signal transduction protein
MPEHHLFLAFNSDDDCYRVPLEDIQEVIRLDGHFGSLDSDLPSVKVRRRTVHIVNVHERLGVAPDSPSKLVVFENDHRLHGIPVERADRAPSRPFRDLSVKDLVLTP